MKQLKKSTFRIAITIILLTTTLSCSSWPAFTGLFFADSESGGTKTEFLALLGLGSGPSLNGITIDPANPSLARGTSLQLTVTGIYSDGSTKDLTVPSTWSSSNANVAISSGGVITGKLIGNATITASVKGKTTTATATVTSAVIESLEITPANSSIAAGFAAQFHATGIFSDHSVQDLTSDPSIFWSTGSGSTTVTSVSATGFVTGNSPGSDTITAMFSGKSAGSSVTVTSASLVGLSVTPTSPVISVNTTKQFAATGTFSDSSTQELTSTATWTPTAGGVIVSSSGLASATSAGSYTITATQGGRSGSTDLTVENCNLTSIAVTPNNPIAYNTSQQFTATGSYSNCPSQDLTGDVVWDSSDTGIATISNASATKGYASSVAAGTTTISATSGAVSGSTTLEVRLITLVSIAILPPDQSSSTGQTIHYTASGTYSDGTIQDLTTQVTWSSSDTATATISNGTGTQGHATTGASGTTTIRATRDGVTGSTSLAVSADTTEPTITSVEIDALGQSLTVTYSENVNVTPASSASNYRVVESVGGICSDNTNFTSSTQTSDFGISSVTVVSPSVYVLHFDDFTKQKLYTLIVHRNNIVDLASTPNSLACENKKTFLGKDTVKPYLVSAISNTPTTIRVKFSEAMTTGTGTTISADFTGSYSVMEEASTTPMTISSVSQPDPSDASLFELTLDSAVTAITYRVTSSTPTDVAGNVTGAPNFLTFLGNEQIKVVSAEAIDLLHVKITFSKPLLSSSASCSTISGCATLYKITPATIGDITQATVSSNSVTLTHSLDQSGTSYTVVVANGISGDGFDNTASIRDSGDTQNVQAAPKDRATFTGLGNPYNTFDDGIYFSDPFVDGTTFSFAFNYGGKIYLGTNDQNNAAFRFDPGGSNSVLTNFAFAAGTCSTASGFGYNPAGSCGADDIGPNGEYGVVGFTSATVQPNATPVEILIAGPIKNGVTRGYYTQDLDTTLDFTEIGFSVTGGANTKSIQTPYAVDGHLYLCMSSDHGTQAPICSYHAVSESGGVVTVNSGTDMSIRSQADLGKNAGGSSNPADVVGIDSIVKFPYASASGKLYLANNGGLYYSANFDTTWSAGAIKSTPAWSGTTLHLPAAPAGLGKVRPGQRGVPRLLEFNGYLYMARNVAAGVTAPSSETASHGELWVCDPTTSGVATDCESADWSRIISGSESDLPATNAISLLQNNGTGTLYVGFDDLTATPSGVRIFRIATTTPPSLTGLTMASAGWNQEGANGLGSSSNRYLFSAASETDGSQFYIYVTTGNGAEAIEVFRQID